MKQLEIRVACIGTGMMGGALMKAVAKVAGGKNLTVSDGNFSKAKAYAAETGCAAVATNAEAAQDADVIFLAVKPFLIEKIVQELSPALSGKIVVSMAAGLKIGRIRQACTADASSVQWVRIMPNLPAVVGEAMIGLCGEAGTSAETLALVASLLAAAGRVEVVEEKLMDAVTAISGSGPAYCFMFIEALADAAVKLGIPRQQAYVYAAQTLRGAATMQLETGCHPAQLKDGVCSPAGTTIAAVEALEQGGFRSTVMAAATAAYNRSVELG